MNFPSFTPKDIENEVIVISDDDEYGGSTSQSPIYGDPNSMIAAYNYSDHIERFLSSSQTTVYWDLDSDSSATSSSIYYQFN